MDGADIFQAMRPSQKPLAADRDRSACWSRAVRIAVFLAVAGAFVPAAHAQSPMIQGWLAANTACKGGPGDDPRTQKACARRDDLSAKLKRRGCDYQADGDWWRCPH